MIEFDPNRIYHEIVSAGDDWTDKEAAADLLEETKKTTLAELMNANPMKTSAAQLEREALSDPVYRLHLTKMVSARKEANRAKVRYDAIRVLAEMRRTQESTRREEMRIR